MQAIGQRLRIGIVALIELHRVPPVFSPVLPVLYNHAHGQAFRLETAGSFENLLRTMETLTAVDIAQCPLRYLRTRASQLAVRCDDLVRRTDEDGVVNSSSNG